MLSEEYINQHRGKYIPALIPGTIITISVSIFGLFGNANIVWASIRKASLRSKCNAFICLVSICDFAHQSTHFVTAFMIFSGRNFMTLQTCYWSQFISAIAMNMGAFLMMFLGLDRLLCVAFPIRYQRIDKWLYFVVTISFPALYAGWINFMGYKAMRENPTELLVCTTPDSFPFWSRVIWAKSTMTLHLLTIITYSAMWITIYTSNSTVDRRIMRCLTIIVTTVLFGFFLISILIYLDTVFKVKDEQLLIHNLYEGILPNLTISLNYVIYFVCSAEYRVAFKEQLSILVCKPIQTSRKIAVKTVVITCQETGN